MLKIWHNVFYKRNNSSCRKYFDLERGGVPPEMMGSLPKVIVDMPELKPEQDSEHRRQHKKEKVEKKEGEMKLSEDLKKEVEKLLVKFFRYESKPKEFAAALKHSLFSNALDVFQKFPQIGEFIKKRMEGSGNTFEELVELIKASENGFDRQKFNEITKKIQSFGNGDLKDIAWLDEFYTEETRRLLERGLQFSPFRSLSCIDRILKMSPGSEDERNAHKHYLALAADKILVGNSLAVAIDEIRIAQSFVRKVEIEDRYKSQKSTHEERYQKYNDQIADDVESCLFPLVAKFIQSGDLELRQKTFDLVGEYCKTSKDQTWSRSLLSQMCVYEIKDRSKFADFVCGTERVNLGFHEIKTLVDVWKKSGDVELGEFLDRFKLLIDKHGSAKNLKGENLDFKRCSSVWVQNFYGHPDPESARINMKAYAAENVKTMLDLENHSPGICKKLTQLYGIRNYARYSRALLERQYDTRENEGRYGIVLNPYDDHNGAFSNKKQVLEHLADQLKMQGVNLRIVEAGGKLGIAKRLLKLDEQYGKHAKIECAVIGAHGAIDHMVFGKTGVLPEDFGLEKQPIEGLSLKEKIKRFIFEERNIEPVPLSKIGKNEIFKQSDLKGRGIGKIKRFFVDFPSILLASCSTGKKGGVGQEISREFNAEVSAPLEDSVLKDIIVNTDEKGRIHLQGVSTNAKLQPIETVQYHKGKKKPLPKVQNQSF
jgi:hypothetical protein